MYARLTRGRMRAVGAAAWLAATSAACSKEPSKAPREPTAITAAAAPATTFRFAPPDGTEFVRHDRRKQEHEIVGAPLRRVDEEELRWNVTVARGDGGYRVKQELAHLTLRRDGAVIVDGKVKEGILAELIIDDNGRLTAVRGLEGTAERLRELAAPEMKSVAEQVITPQRLADVVATRYRLMFGEIVGREAAPGTTWAITNPPGSLITSRRVTVERHEDCGGARCARLRVDFDVDPRVVTETAVALVRARVDAAGGDPSNLKVRAARYGVSGAMLLEPATMLSHGAALAEEGRVTVEGPSGEEVTVATKGELEVAYSYRSRPVAESSLGSLLATE